MLSLLRTRLPITQIVRHVKGEAYRQVPKISTQIRGGTLFNDVFGKYLFITNTVTSGVLMGLGDLAQQEIEYRRHMMAERYDWARMGKKLFNLNEIINNIMTVLNCSENVSGWIINGSSTSLFL